MRNAKLKNEPSAPLAGAARGQGFFFPENQNTLDSYILLKGNAIQVNEALQKLEYCPQKVT